MKNHFKCKCNEKKDYSNKMNEVFLFCSGDVEMEDVNY